jgi:hypothetical protein
LLQVVPVIVIAAVAMFTHRTLFAWRTLLPALVLTILFIPIRRYAFPGNLPFELEPYRLVVLFIGLGWLASLLVDRRVRARLTGLEGPLVLLLVAAIGSIVLNPGHVTAIQGDVVKRLTFFLSFLLITHVIVSLVRTLAFADLLVKSLVLGGTIVAAFSMLEARTGYNVFNHLASVIPILRVSELPEVPGRGARLRVYGSAQHPIALGALLVMLVPLAAYLVRRTMSRRWMICVGVLTIGATATVCARAKCDACGRR